MLFFGYGRGANGKTTFASVLLGIFGPAADGYGAVAPIATFIASHNEQHPTDLAMLRGVVSSSRGNRGRPPWAVSKVKT